MWIEGEEEGSQPKVSSGDMWTPDSGYCGDSCQLGEQWIAAASTNSCCSWQIDDTSPERRQLLGRQPGDRGYNNVGYNIDRRLVSRQTVANTHQTVVLHHTLLAAATVQAFDIRFGIWPDTRPRYRTSCPSLLPNKVVAVHLKQWQLLCLQTAESHYRFR